jgi:putative methyltransferase (TIGR04325 family)
MSQIIKDIKLFIPPIVLIAARKIRLLLGWKPPSLLEGPYSTWQEAVTNSAGWDAPEILDKTLELSLKMRDGIIEFQQDLIEYRRICYSETILAFLSMSSGMNHGKLDIVDFGGSLGTNFAQNRKFLRPFIDDGNCHWNIVERPPTVDLGRKHFENHNLRFFASLDEIKMQRGYIPKFYLFSGSMQCVEEPFSLLDLIIADGANLIAFDRILVSPKTQHEILIQPHHGITFPTWCFSRNLFVQTMAKKGFAFVEEFSIPPGEQFDCQRGPDRDFYWAGLIFVRDKQSLN